MVGQRFCHCRHCCCSLPAAAHLHGVLRATLHLPLPSPCTDGQTCPAKAQGDPLLMARCRQPARPPSPAMWRTAAAASPARPRQWTVAPASPSARCSRLPRLQRQPPRPQPLSALKQPRAALAVHRMSMQRHRCCRVAAHSPCFPQHSAQQAWRQLPPSHPLDARSQMRVPHSQQHQLCGGSSAHRWPGRLRCRCRCRKAAAAPTLPPSCGRLLQRTRPVASREQQQRWCPRWPHRPLPVSVCLGRMPCLEQAAGQS